MRLEDFVDARAVEALSRPMSEALGLPGVCYGEAFYEFERQSLFPRTWCPVAVASEIPNPGDVLPVNLAEWPLVLTRTEEGEVKAFYNVCRHRGMKLVARPCRNRQRMACPWHGWTYDLGGNLIATPNYGGPGKQDSGSLDRTRLGLKPVRLGLWHDYVFVNLDGRAPALEEHMRDCDQFLSTYPFQALQYGATWETVYEGNWKLSVEGGIEEYHIPWVHAQYVDGMVDYDTRFDLGRRCHIGIDITMTYRQTIDEPNSPQSVLPPLPGRTNEGPWSVYFVGLFPVGFMSLHRNHAVLGLYTPDGWNRTRVVLHHYYAGSVAVDPRYAEARRLWEDTLNLVFQQDADFVKTLHENTQKRDALSCETRFAPYWEPPVRHFQRLLVATLNGGSLK